MLLQRIHRERPRRVGGGRQHILEACHLDDVGRVPAAGALGVEGVDGAALEGSNGGSTKPDSLSVSVWIITCTS